MAAPATQVKDLNLIAPGSRVVVRDLDWQVVEVERHGMGTKAIVRCVGRSELVRGQAAAFHSDLDRIEPEDPTRTKFRLDDSPGGIETRLIIESLMRRTPLPVANKNLTVGQSMLADPLPYQREPFRVAMEQLQPRLLVADSVGLGKTIEVGMILAELQRRGRADRVLVVVPRHILDQVQHELWCRADFPLVRLDSDGIQRLRQHIPAGRNPFAYFNRVIVSIDTIKNPSRYRHHLERVRWDVVWIDESHKLVNKGTLNNQLARVIAPNADALILTSATPHNGRSEAFAELISLLDPTAVADPEQVTARDIAHLFVRRHKHSPDVKAVIGDRWAERVEPLPVLVEPTQAEEAIFADLSANWIGPGITPPSADRLFPWTLLKAALSSPVALSETIQRRLARRRLSSATDESTLDQPASPEVEALQRLHTLAENAHGSGTAKITELIKVLKAIGVGRNSDVRAVVFSERIATLDWIASEVKQQLRLRDAEVETFHNSKSDEEQQAVIEDFSLAQAPIRVLVTSDIASEGVNLHKQCHHLIHFDLPWSLITLEQRNGRIDRYGQEHPPEIRYLIYSPDDPEVASDVRIVTKLVEREHTAHKALGDAGAVMGVYSESAEEERIIEALRQRSEEEREAKFEEVAPDRQAFDPWAFVGLTSEPASPALPPEVPIKAPPSLFDGDAAYLEAALRHAFDYNLDQLGWETDGPVLSFRPPEDLLARLGSLPQSYLRQRNLADRLRVTDDEFAANQSLAHAISQRAEAGETGTAWPEVHYLGPQHPVLEWIADKILYRVARNEALAIACGVSEPTLLVSGVWSNKLGEPIASAWLGATMEGDLPVFEDLYSVLARAGLTSAVINRPWEGQLTAIEAMLGRVVNAAITSLSENLEAPLKEINDRLALHRERLETWQSEARKIADGITSDSYRRRRLSDIDRVTRQIDALIAERTPADAPLVRIVGALLPEAR